MADGRAGEMSRDRLDELEQSRSIFEAEMMALVMKAEGQYQAANNAESRTRTMKKSYEKLIDPFEIDSEEMQEAPVQPLGNDEQPLPLELPPNNKAYALRAKWL